MTTSKEIIQNLYDGNLDRLRDSFREGMLPEIANVLEVKRLEVASKMVGEENLQELSDKKLLQYAAKAARSPKDREKGLDKVDKKLSKKYDEEIQKESMDVQGHIKSAQAHMEYHTEQGEQHYIDHPTHKKAEKLHSDAHDHFDSAVHEYRQGNHNVGHQHYRSGLATGKKANAASAEAHQFGGKSTI